MQMFHSATLKLTAWYLGILMTISVIFSFSIYLINFHEVSIRLENLQNNLLQTQSISTPFASGDDDFRELQAEQAAAQMILSLIYINIIILVGGGLGSYFLARRTLKPIEQAHEAQSRFTSDASHELRTPLAAMKAEIEVSLRDAKIDPAEARELLESNLEEVNKLIALSEMLLSMSRLDYDRLENSPVDMQATLEEVLKPYTAMKKRFTVNARKKAQATGDKAAFAELMRILIENALKYSPEKSKIAIRIYERMGRIGFEITNVGTISQKDIDHVFERFYRGDQSRTKSSENGLGLGLALAKKIVEIHAGDIHVFTKNGKVTFTVSLPILRISR